MLLTFLLLVAAAIAFVLLTARRIGAFAALWLAMSWTFTGAAYLKTSQSLGTANPLRVELRLIDFVGSQLRCRLKPAKDDSRCPDGDGRRRGNDGAPGASS